MNEPVVSKKCPFFGLFLAAAILMLVFLALSLFLYVQYLAVFRSNWALAAPSISAYVSGPRENFTFEAMEESYPAGTDTITFRLTSQNGDGFHMEGTYYVEKDDIWDSKLFAIWPTHSLFTVYTEYREHVNNRKRVPASEDGEPVVVEFKVRLKDWGLRPVRGEYTLYTPVNFTWTGGEGPDYIARAIFSASFTIR